MTNFSRFWDPDSQLVFCFLSPGASGASLNLRLIAKILRMSRFLFYLKVFRRKSSSRFALTRPSPSKLGPFRVWLLTRPLLSQLGPFCVWLLTRPWLSKLGLFRVWLQVFRQKNSSRECLSVSSIAKVFRMSRFIFYLKDLVFRRTFSSRLTRKFKFKFDGNKIRASRFVLY